MSGAGTGTVAVGGGLFTAGELDTFCSTGTTTRAFSAEEYADGHAFAQELIEDYCRRIIISRSFTEEIDVEGANVVFGNWPVTAIASITTGWTNPDEATEEYTSADYRRKPWGAKFAGKPSGHFLTCVYTAGESAVPADIKWAALSIAKERVLPRERPEGVSSLSSDGVNYSFITAAPNAPTGNDKVDAILNRWRLAKVRIG